MLQLSVGIAPEGDRSKGYAVAAVVAAADASVMVVTLMMILMMILMMMMLMVIAKREAVWKRKEGEKVFSTDMARLQFMQRVTYATTALVPRHSASTDASNRRTHFWGLLYSCLQPFAASFCSPGRHKTHARFKSPGQTFACFLTNLQSFSGCR